MRRCRRRRRRHPGAASSARHRAPRRCDLELRHAQRQRHSRAIAAQRPASRSIATARPRARGAAAIRSRSSRSRRRRPTGAGRAAASGAASVAARTSRLVSWPSARKASSGSPGTRGSDARPGPGRAFDRERVERLRRRRSPARDGRLGDALARAAQMLEAPSDPARAEAARRRAAPRPGAGVSPSSLRTSSRAPGARCRCRVPSGRRVQAHRLDLGQGQPSRAQARAKRRGRRQDRAARPGGKRRSEQLRRSPNHIGSPLASTTTGRPRQRRDVVERRRRAARRQVSCSPAWPGTIARWRSPPTSTSAASSSARAAGAQRGQAVLADADDAEPGRVTARRGRHGASASSALTAAAARLLPPRRPRSVT